MGSDSGTLGIEEAVRNQLGVLFANSYGKMQTYFEDWDTFWQLFESTFTPDVAEGEFADLHIAMAAKSIERARARLRKAAIPDRQNMRFFAGMPKETSLLEPGIDDHERLAALQQAALQHDLLRTNFSEVFDLSTLDYEICGNMYWLPCWEMVVGTRFEKEEDPLYQIPIDQPLPDGYYRVEIPIDPGFAIVTVAPSDTGDDVEETIPRYRTVARTVKEYDAPKVLYVNPYNVFPTESDKNSISECTGVFIYDACVLSDLLEDEIMDGRGNYTNLGDVEANEDVPSVIGGGVSEDDDVYSSYGAKRVERITYYGRIDWRDLLESVGVVKDSPEWFEFLEKFNADPERDSMKTWVLEFAGTNTGSSGGLGTLIRCQPLPYNKDEIPLVHCRKYFKTNRTIGYGDYRRTEIPERIYNSFNRMRLEQLQNLSNPPVMVYEELLDSIWIQQNGGFESMVPGMMIRGISPQMGNPVQPIQLPTEGLNFSSQAMADMQSAVEQQSNPGVVAGQVSGAATAREVTVASSGVDIMDDLKAEDVGGCLGRLLQWMGALHMQYECEPRTFYLPGEDGKLARHDIPPDAWSKEMIWFTTSAASPANRQVALEMLKIVANEAKESGQINWKNFVVRVAKLTDTYGLEDIIQDPPGPEPNPARTTANIMIPFERLPANAQVKALQKLDWEVDESMAPEFERASRAMAAMDGDMPLPDDVVGPMPQSGGGVDFAEQPPGPIIDEMTETNLLNIQGSLQH